MTQATSARVSDDTGDLARVSDDTGDLARVSDDIGGPIRLWHVSPTGLRHVSLTHPQTPINKSLLKTFQMRLRKEKGLRLRLKKRLGRGWSWGAGEDQDWEVQKLCWNQALKPPRTSTSNTKNIRREIIQIIFLDLKGHWNQAQKPPKTSTNHKLVKLYGFKPPKPWRTSTTNLQIRRTFEAESSKLPA